MRFLTLLLVAMVGVAGFVVSHANETETVEQKVASQEIVALEQWVARATATHKRIDELRTGGFPGGEPQNELLARFQMLISQAQLASAKCQPDECKKLWTAAVSTSDECIKATEAAYDSGRVTLDRLVLSQQQHATARIELSRVERRNSI